MRSLTIVRPCWQNVPLAKANVGDDVVHLRHDILVNRLKYLSNATPEAEKQQVFERALKGLERYFFLIAVSCGSRSTCQELCPMIIQFAAYVDESDVGFKRSFYTWIDERSEVRNMISRINTTRKLFIFAPVHDLSGTSTQR